MEQRPQDYQRRRDQQPEYLVAPEEPLLLGPPRDLFLPLEMRFDASLHRSPLESSIGFAAHTALAV
jgi:hypothetical protein